jgi:hypothetical protein
LAEAKRLTFLAVPGLQVSEAASIRLPLPLNEWRLR